MNNRIADRGDTIIVMLDRSDVITTEESKSVCTVRLDILAHLSASYLAYVPRAVHISHSKQLTRRLQEKLQINESYLGCQIVAVPPGAVTRFIVNTDGMKCSWCSKWIPMAGPNQDDGSLRCYRCTNDPYVVRQIP